MPNQDEKSKIVEELRKIMDQEAISDPSLTKDEQEKVIRLVKFIIETDYSNESVLRENLKKKLLQKGLECELEDDELDYAAGGLMQEFVEEKDKD